MGSDDVQAGPDIYYDGFMDRAEFEYKYSLWPRRCYNTGRWLWLETAMHGRAI